jgi:hypothetical protein
MIDGTDFRLAPALAAAPAPPTAQMAFDSGVGNLRTDDIGDLAYDLEVFHVKDAPQVSLDWGEFTANAAFAGSYDLYSDTGANIHISPFHEDFQSFTPIPPRAIKGFQGSSIDASGVGTIVNNKFILHNAYYVPQTSICLMSVSHLCQDNNYTCHFDTSTTWITDASGHVICTGSIQRMRDLYKLHCSPSTPPIVPPITATACSID